MHNRYSDFEELQPTGEASHIPDTRLDDGCEGDPRRQCVATSTGGYPDAPTTTDGECRSGGKSVPVGQTKCRFCLTNHLGSDATSTDESASTTFLGIVHLVVESTTFYGAVAKGGAAANLLSANEAEPAVDDYTLIYDLDEAPARQLADRWPSLPTAVQVRQRRVSGFSVPPVTGLAGRGRERRSVRSRPQRGSTTSGGTASAAHHGSLGSSRTPTMPCGWFQRWC